MIPKKAFRKRIRLVTSVGLAALLYFYCSPPALAQLAPPPAVGAASTFAVKGGSSVTAATLGIPETVITGDVGVSTGTSITGFPPATTAPPFIVHAANDPATILAQASILSLYNDLFARTGTLTSPVLAGATFPAGIYDFSGTGVVLLAATTSMTLTGAGDHIFLVNNALTADVFSSVLFGPEVDPCRVFWLVPTQATLNGDNFVGNVIAGAAIVLGAGADLQGRALTTVAGAVTMAGNNTVGGCSGTSSLLLVKQALTASFTNAGDAISYSYVVTNSGTSALAGPISVADDTVAVTCPAVVSLLPGDAITCTATYLATSADVIAGFITNIATAHAGSTVSNEATTTVPGTPQVPPAAITILKKTNGTDNPAPTGPIVLPGSIVNWTYLVTNTGGVTLTNVTVVDNQPGVVVSCPFTVLAAGASMTCTASGIAILGQYINLGTATGTPPTGLDVIAVDVDHYKGLPQVCETYPPSVFFWKTIYGPPKQVVLKAKDGGGITSITVVVSQNIANVTYSMFPSGSPTFTVFPPGGITGTIYIFATKDDQSLGSVIGVRVTDLCGNATIYDPWDKTVNAGTRETITGVLEDETLMQIVNNGLRELRITVNGRSIVVRNLGRNETRIVNIAKAMEPGNNNTIILTARGPKGSSADVTGYPPPAANAQEENARRERREHYRGRR